MIDTSTNPNDDWMVAFTWSILPGARAWQRAAGNAFAEHGISLSLAGPVLVIARMGNGLRQREVAEAAGIDAAAVARSVAQLERDGLLVRKPDKHDGRANTLHLTRSGKALAVSLDRILVDLRQEMFASVSEAEGKGMVKILGLLEGWE